MFVMYGAFLQWLSAQVVVFNPCAPWPRPCCHEMPHRPCCCFSHRPCSLVATSQVAVQDFEIGWNFTDGESIVGAGNVTAPLKAVDLAAPQVRQFDADVGVVCMKFDHHYNNRACRS